MGYGGFLKSFAGEGDVRVQGEWGVSGPFSAMTACTDMGGGNGGDVLDLVDIVNIVGHGGYGGE